MHLRIIRFVISIAIAISLVFSLPITSLGVGLSDAQDFEQTATLVSPRSDAPISIALRPAPNQPNVGYGISGHTVTVLEQVGDYLAFDDPNATWCHIRLEDKPYTEGWIQGKFLSISPPQTSTQETH